MVAQLINIILPHSVIMNPKVSVIIPAYNTEAYIAKAIESALTQTVQAIEVIVVDDASTDTTVEIANGFSDSRLQVVVNQQNLGAGLTRNKGIALAKGEWIALLDSDDWYAPERLEKLLQIGEEKNADVVADNLLIIQDGSLAPHAKQSDISSEKIDTMIQVDALTFLQTDTCGKMPLFSCTKPLMRRSFLHEHGLRYDSEIARMGEDFRLYLRCLIHGARFFFTPEGYYFQRLRRGSLTTLRMANIINDFYVGNQHLIKEELFQQYPEVVEFLIRDGQILKKNFAYYSVVDPIKRKQWLNALAEAVRNPSFFVHFAHNLPGILFRRLSHLN